MSGHSKWSTIKRKKGALDEQKSAKFTRLIKEIMSAAREGGCDVKSNPHLKLIVQKAKDINIPKDKIEAAINRCRLVAKNCQKVIYCGRFSVGGYVVIVECMTDNPTRTVGEIRSLFNSEGVKLVRLEDVNFLFNKKVVFNINKSEVTDLEGLTSNFNSLFNDIAEIECNEDEISICCDSTLNMDVKDFLQMNSIDKFIYREIFSPNKIIDVPDEHKDKIFQFLKDLYESDDVSYVYTNIKE